jgi:peptide/nickel transport system permease protein
VGAYLARRLLIAVPVLLGITLIAFVVLALAPGDPVRALIDPETLAGMSEQQLADRRHELGLDGSPVERYVRWLGGVVQGDLGYSIKSGRSIADEVAPRVGPTLLLMGTSLLLAIGVGIPFGVAAAIRQYGLLDYALTGVTLLLICTPTFVLGLILIYVLGVSLRVLPVGGMFSLGREGDVMDRIAHLVMPAAILGSVYAAQLMRYTRAGMLEVLNSDYVTTARAKGLRGRTVLVRHGLRNALLPIITVLGLLVPELVAGAIITEQVFSWPGTGLLAVRAAADRDPSLMMAIVLIFAIAVLVSNLVADIAYTVADPRVRLDSRR